MRMRFACIATGVLMTMGVFAQPPLLMNYQGRILSGTNLLQGAVDLSLRLYANPAGGALLYEDTGTVTVVDSVYATYLGDGTSAGDLVTALSLPAVYLELVVNGTVLSPRERLASVPYALQALAAAQHTELDPAFGASVAAGITAAHTTRWETAYGWGDHGAAGYLTSYAESDPLWAGASNAYYTAAQADAVFATGTPVYVESDPVFGASVAAGITGAETTRWETAYSWGDHGAAGYLTSYTETDPLWSSASNAYYTAAQADAVFATGTPIYVESDPVFGASVAAGITGVETTRWETAYSWGDHAGAGYLTSFVETDPQWAGASNAYYTATQVDAAFATGMPLYVESDPAFSVSVAAGITGVETLRWETAYGWGDHGAAGYLTSYAESDPQWSGASNAYYTAAQADAVFATGMPLYVESDPAFAASIAASITSAETSRWETAYGWGDHGAAGYLTGFTEVDPLWSGASNAYYTAAQADAAFATGTPVYVESDPVFSTSVAAGITSSETARWETAYGWGDHGTAGYLTSFTEVDPLWSAASNAYYTAAQVDAVFATGTPVYAESDPAFSVSVAAGITSVETTRWETAYVWGDHGAAGYLTSFTEADPLWSAASNAYYTAEQADAAFATGTPVYAESDPAFSASVAAGITSTETTRWETAYSWGDHGAAGYLTSYTETDPLWSSASNAYYTAAQADVAFATGTPVYVESDPAFSASVAAGITSTETTRWETAYGWGDHGAAGYLTGYTETDPLWSAASNAYYTAAQVDAAFATGTPLYVESDAVWAGASNLYYQRSEADALFATGAPLYVESDAVFAAAVAAGITSLHTTRWETAYGWGNHGAAGYLTSFSESDPQWAAASNSYYTAAQADARFSTGTPVYVESDALYAVSVAAQITASHTSRWETAFGWGNHATNGYMTGAASSNSFVRKTGDSVSLGPGGLVVGATQLVVLANGNVGIGTATPTNQLAVNGSIKAREVIVTANNWPDYVFDPDYRLAPLRDVQAFIAEKGHLPGVPSAATVEQEGVPLGEFGATLLRKIEELTLHQIALEQENERLRRDLDELRASVRPVAP